MYLGAALPGLSPAPRAPREEELPVARPIALVLLVLVAAVAFPSHSQDVSPPEVTHDHPPVAAGCVACHQRDRQGFRDFNKTCVVCHADKRAGAQRYSHEPTTTQVCTSCHKLHKAPEEGLLRQDPLTTCQVCHTDHDRAGSHPVGLDMADRRRGGPLTCTSTCHDPHGSDHRGLVRITGDRLCFACHDK
jgi:predicted CXXCH cytochrome family protein